MGGILKRLRHVSANIPRYKVTRTKGWAQLMEEYIPDKLVVKKHLELLNHASYKAVATGVDMAYKLKGKYKDGNQGTRVLVINVPPDKKNMVEQALESYFDNETEDPA